jgi:hypothetical protein
LQKRAVVFHLLINEIRADAGSPEAVATHVAQQNEEGESSQQSANKGRLAAERLDEGFGAECSYGPRQLETCLSRSNKAAALSDAGY